MPESQHDDIRDQLHRFLGLDDVESSLAAHDKRLSELQQTLDDIAEHLNSHDHVICAGDSIQDAYDDGQNHLPVAATYDPRADDYPLVFDEERPLSIEGVGPGVTRLGHLDVADDPVIDIVGHGAATYKQAPTVRNLSIVGGSPGIKLRSAPYTSLSNVYLLTEGHGLHIAEGKTGTYSTSLFNVQAWNCGGDGFRLDGSADTHATQFYGCHAVACVGVGFRLRGYMTAMHGGSSQLNHSYGLDVRTPSISVKGAYIEGNARREDYPVELYGRRAHGLSVRDCYFHGAAPRTMWHEHDGVQRGVNLHESQCVTIEGNVYRDFGDAFFAGFDCPDYRLDRNWPVDETLEVAES